MNAKTNLDESLNLSEKILLYISKHEPLTNNDVNEFITNSGIDEKKMKLNIVRLESAGLIEGELIKTISDEYFAAAISLRLTYTGMKEIQALLNQKGAIKEVEINLGLIKFKI